VCEIVIKTISTLRANLRFQAQFKVNHEPFRLALYYSSSLFSQLAHPFAASAKARLAFRPTSSKKVPIILVIAVWLSDQIDD